MTSHGHSADRQSLLRSSLRANAAFSATSGAVFAGAAAALARALGLSDPRLVAATGMALLGFAALLVAVAARPAIHLPTGLAIALLDLAWVVGTLLALLTGLLEGGASLGALAIADVVLVFALLQLLGVRRARRDPLPAPR